MRARDSRWRDHMSVKIVKLTLQETEFDVLRSEDNPKIVIWYPAYKYRV